MEILLMVAVLPLPLPVVLFDGLPFNRDRSKIDPTEWLSACTRRGNSRRLTTSMMFDRPAQLAV